MEKRQRIEEALKEIGIHSIKDLNEAIKKEKPLDLGIMVRDASKQLHLCLEIRESRKKLNI